MISIRPAESSDGPPLFEWRNDPVSRAASAHTHEVAWEDHVVWLAEMLTSPLHRLYLAEEADVDGAVGMVRFDIDDADESADVSINLNPVHRGRGVGLAVLTAAIVAFDAERESPMRLHAVIRPENQASIRLFVAAGFVPDSDDGELRHFRREVA